MIEAVSTSEMSVDFYLTTGRKIPEDSHLHTRRRENLSCLMTVFLIRKLNVFIIALVMQ
jgi:hypothetical protein